MKVAFKNAYIPSRREELYQLTVGATIPLKLCFHRLLPMPI